MTRQRLKPGEWGKITNTVRSGTDVAKVRIRDRDGKLRLVEATGTSAEDARRNVQKKLTERVAPTGARAALSARSPMTDLAAYWLDEKRDAVEPQTLGTYTDTWERVCNPALGSLLVEEVTTGTVDAFLRTTAKTAPSRARVAQIVCSGIFSTAVRLDLIPHNPARETTRPKIRKKPVRAITVDEFAAVREKITDYCRHEELDTNGVVRPRPGPKPGVDLQDIMDLLIATGGRIGEVLAILRDDVDLSTDPATVAIRGTLIVPRIKGEKLRRQEYRKGDAPPLTVMLPQFAADTLRHRLSQPVPEESVGAVFITGTGNWVSPANVRRAWRAALGQEYDWVKPHSFRRTVATLVKQQYGVEGAQAQLGHANTRVTEAHYIERVTNVPDMTSVLNTFGPAVTQSIE
ncbi:site-specific integrase [Rhodococcus marinonascens]|uniref:site-specific integrase n=1 Tax=Rhodococcus marinonascens TaxID=38311 RepID=UPI000934FCBF|nr:tyrosine-type recombinase/integrase [Rhodococcus marinonascens]